MDIELDGSVHEDKRQAQYDKVCQKAIEALGTLMVRFKNEEVINNVEKVTKELQVLSQSLNS